MKPYEHALTSVRKWGGTPEDYLPIHDMLDSSKIAHGTMRHRAVYHHTLGCFMMEKVFGHNITNTNGRLVSVREVAELHIIEDLGWLPSLDDWMRTMELQSWMGKPTKVVTEYKLGE